jgi:PEP-CTERM motif-containing protein
MKLHELVCPTALLIAGSFSASAGATVVVDDTDYDATLGGTQITLAGAATPQYTFELDPFIEDFTKTYLNGNDGATAAYPGDTVYSSSLLTRGVLGSTTGDYGLEFSANGVDYAGIATVINDGNTIDRITYDVVDRGVPEPATWAMMVLGFGVAGAALRRSRRRQQSFAIA